MASSLPFSLFVLPLSVEALLVENIVVLRREQHCETMYKVQPVYPLHYFSVKNSLII
jgi:hypothetical protein